MIVNKIKCSGVINKDFGVWKGESPETRERTKERKERKGEKLNSLQLGRKCS